MGLETATLMTIGSIALSGVTSFVQMGMAKSNAEAQAQAAQRTFEARDEELTRQQRETNRIANEEKSDIIRKAELELGAINAAAGELGATGSAMDRMVTELAAVEGMDLSRIEHNRENKSAALQASKEAAAVGANNTISTAYNQAKSQMANAALGFAGSGLQIASKYHQRQTDLEIARNKV